MSAQAIPYSQEAEEAFVGGVITDCGLLPIVKSLVKPDDLFLLRVRYVWQAALRLDERKEPLDYMLLIQELKDMGKLEEVGGPAYLTHLINACPSSVHTEAYARLVQRAAIRRRMIAGGDKIKALALDDEKTAEEAIADMARITADIQGADLGKPEPTLRELVSTVWAHIEQRMENPDTLLGIPVGFRDLDNVILGLQKSDLNIWAAVTGMGKTSMMLSAALNMARRGVRIGFVTQEMEADQITRRLIALESGLNLQAVRSGNMSKDQYARFVASLKVVSELPIYIHSKRVTPDQLRAKALNWMTEGGMDVLFVDYLQIMASNGMYKGNQRTQEVSYFARSLKDLAMELHIPVVVAAQLNRDVGKRQDKRPILDDLRESGEIEQAADIVTFIYRDEYYNEATEFPNQADLIIAKHRNGPTGTISLYFEKTTTKFMNASERSVDLSRL
jgi:replicative DNA helicase